MRHRVVLSVLVLMLASPAAIAAGWGSRGDAEPSTARDRIDGDMFLNRSTDDVRRVYFNGFASFCVGYVPAYCTSMNANVGSLGTAHQSYPYRALAMLGVWRDCNNDGYMGMGEQGLIEYPARLLALPGAPGDSICAPESVPDPIPRNWMPVHNDGTLVREYIPIGWDEGAGSSPCKKSIAPACSDFNPYNINDSGSRVWSDWDLPGQAPGTQCYVSAHPRGTFHSVDGMRQLADCFASNKIESTIMGSPAGPTYTSVKGNDCDNSYLTDYHAGCNPWGEPKQASFVDAFDCKKEDQLFQAPQFVDLDGDKVRDEGEPMLGSTVNVSHPRGAPGTTTRGSIAGTFNETHSDFDDCREHATTDRGLSDLPYATEASLQNQNGRRFQTDQIMRHYEGIRPWAPTPVYKAVYGTAAAEDLGTGLNSYDGLWYGTTITAASRNPYLNRDTVQPMAVTYTTYYARVSDEAIATYGLVVPPSPGTYGSEACGTAIGPNQPDKAGWACDPAAWWPLDATGARTMPRWRTSMGLIDIGAKVGEGYQLRDIDCWDESTTALRNEGVSFGVLSGSRCV